MEKTLTINTNGHEYVDLGLPSGTLWATCNVGADSPNQPGLRFAWGETETKNIFSIENYFERMYNNKNAILSYSQRTRWTLAENDDAAAAVMHGEWHIPTERQARELRDNCLVKVETVDGTPCWVYESKHNGKKLLFPVDNDVNAIWVNELATGSDTMAKCMYYGESATCKGRVFACHVRGCITVHSDIPMRWIKASDVAPQEGQHVIGLLEEFQGEREVVDAHYRTSTTCVGENEVGETTYYEDPTPYFEGTEGEAWEVEYWMPVPEL